MASNVRQLKLPTEKLPDCWKDKTHMNALFAPFRSRSANPDDWDYKLTFWKTLICESCIESKVYTFKTEDLQKLFYMDGRPPECIDVVVDELYKTGVLQPLDVYLQKPANTWGEWASDLLFKKPMLWSYGKIKDKLISPQSNCYVHLEAIRKEADNLLASIPNNFGNKVICFEELLDVLELDYTHVARLKLLFHYLTCKNLIDVKEVATDDKIQNHDVPLKNVLIKFGDIEKVGKISDVDISIYILEEKEKNFTKDIENMENEITSLINEAKTHLTKGHKRLAKNCLIKKHDLESKINKKVNTLQNVQGLLSRITEASADSQILDSYKLALSTLKASFKDTGLSEDAVINTMNDLGEMLDIHQDIQKTLGQPLIESDADLEEELAEIMKDDTYSTPPKPPPVLKTDEDEDTLNLEKRLERLRMPISTPVISSKERVVL